MVKKYLISSFAVLAAMTLTTSCSNDDVFDASKDINVAQYEAKFIQKFGKPSPNQTWGFEDYGTRAATRANAGETYPQTSTGINANANEWADPNKEFGGWVVPDPLTDKQKLRVRLYFQTHPNLSFEDPELRHFFVQQVYKGGSSKYGVSTENIKADNGTVYDSNNMNLLTVGQNHQHINNYNAGNCSVNNSVLNNGGNVNDGPYHSDQIMLMVNIDDTSCFGYHETGSSTHHDNKAALVAASVIDEWAASAEAIALNIDLGDDVVDKWNRSFLGFDLALKEGAQAQSNVAVKYNDGPESYNYAKVNGEIVAINGNDNIIFNNNTVYYIDTNNNMYTSTERKNVGDGELQPEYRVNGEYKGKYLNVDKIMELLGEGFLPIKDKNLREWVKVGKSDGYFTDWIVTLTKAERIDTPVSVIRVMAEDLTVGDINSDFDFNDIVFDVKWVEVGAEITIRAAGGTLPLTIGGQNGPDGVEVHEAFAEVNKDKTINTDFSKGKLTMINTYAGRKNEYVCPVITLEGNFKNAEGKNNANLIKLFVNKGTEDQPKWTEMKAERGKVAAKFGVDPKTDWCDERQDIEKRYPLFGDWVRGDESFFQ